MIRLRRSRMNESAAYNSALNEVRYDVEHEFKPIDLPRNWYIGIDDVEYDYDELSATVFVLNDKEEVVETETVSIPVDTMKDYTTDEMYRLKIRMLEKINDVVEDFKDTWSDSEDYNESKVKRSRRSRMNESGSRYYESLSNSDAEKIMDNLREQNTSNKLDSENFRWVTALNLFQILLDEWSKGYPYNSDLDVLRKFKKAGYSGEARDLIYGLTGAVNRRIKELTQLKNDLKELEHIAIQFDILPGH